MEWQGWLSLALTVGALATLALSRVGPHLIMMGVLLVLTLTGVLNSKEAFSGFANEGVLTVAAMFVVAQGIHASGGVDLVVKYLLGHPSTARMAQLRIIAPVIGLSAFLNNTPLVATMIPAVSAWAKKIDIAPSKLMIPLSYSAIIGGTITLIGTSTNLVVNGQYQQLTGNPGFSLFDITPIGLPVAIIAGFFMFWWFPRALPDRRDDTAFGNMREFTLEVAVAHNGPLVGKTIVEAGLRHLKRVFLIEIEREGEILTAVPPDEKLCGGDRLVFAGDVQAISDLLRINGIVASAHHERPVMEQARAERQLVEVVISPHTDCIGETIRDSNFRDRYGAAVLAVARNGERVSGNLGSIRLEVGDCLLLEARPEFAPRQRHTKDFLLVNDLDEEPPHHERALAAWAILLAIIGLASFDVLPMLEAALLGAAAMIVSRCCTAHQGLKSVDLTVILTIAASFALGTALQKTGVAAFIADTVVSVSAGNPLQILVLTYITVVLLTEILSNNAAAVLTLPIALEMTARAHLNVEPFVFAVMIGASAGFATPIGYQTNLMVYGPGNYRFSDFIKVGIPMNFVVGISAIIMLTLLYDLRA